MGKGRFWEYNKFLFHLVLNYMLLVFPNLNEYLCSYVSRFKNGLTWNFFLSLYTAGVWSLYYIPSNENCKWIAYWNLGRLGLKYSFTSKSLNLWCLKLPWTHDHQASLQSEWRHFRYGLLCLNRLWLSSDWDS